MNQSLQIKIVHCILFKKVYIWLRIKKKEKNKKQKQKARRSLCVYLIVALVQSLHSAQPSSTDSSMVLTIMKRDVQ